MAVFVWDKRKQPLMPCSEKRARLLLKRGRAVVHKRYPFTIRLKDRVGGDTQPLRLKLDPGSKTTGLAMVRAYLLEKWGRACAYCGATETPLEVEHVVPRSCGGSNRISNLALSCHNCNQAKDALPLADFFATDKGLKKRLKANGLSADGRLERVQRQLKQPLRDASAVNATRWALFTALKATGLAVTVSTGGRTKYNRQRLGIPKTHALDAACVGPMDALHHWQVPTLTIKATGRGSYQRTRLTKHGFPRGYLMRQKQVHGFQTGDMVSAIVPAGRKAGTHTGRVAVRRTGRFNIQTQQGAVQGISHTYCTVIQRGDGYGYHLTITTHQRKGGAGQAVA
ncbi:hypothetical protein GCM10022228_03080 [Halomonas cibimaris]|uniref:HNH nuclease domain-containing protein n=2 Tax=Halomonas cibimaris TaxID=657012 RepID=A0ABP7L9G8_9GAMM